jgi:putative IMPACT (imprinted ancient) family translation regulator
MLQRWLKGPQTSRKNTENIMDKDLDLEEGDLSRKRPRHYTGNEDDKSVLQSMNDMQQDLMTHRSDQGQLSAEVQSLSIDQVGMAKQIELLTNTIIKQDKVITNLANSMLDSQKRSMMNNVVIHNVQERDDENCKRAAEEAITTKGVKVKYEVERAHRTGPKRRPGETPRPLIVRMTRQDQAYSVIKASIPAKDQRLPKGAIKITPQNPDRTRYERAKMGQLAYQVKEKSPSVKVTVKNDHYLIDGTKHKDEVKPPTTEAILTQSVSQEDACRKINFYQTTSSEEQGSKFKIFSTEIANSDEANLAYKAVQRFKMAATSTHLISAYRTTGKDQGWQDDGDHGMGRHLYNAIKDKGLSNIIVFLARDFGGIHMGMRRFKLVTEMVGELRTVIRKTQRKVQAKQQSSQSLSANLAYGPMVVQVEGRDDDHELGQDEDGSEDGSLTLEDIRTWDANKIITRPKIGGYCMAPDYFDNPKGIKKPQRGKEGEYEGFAKSKGKDEDNEDFDGDEKPDDKDKNGSTIMETISESA